MLSLAYLCICVDLKKIKIKEGIRNQREEVEVELVTGQRCQQSHSSSRRALTQIGRGQPRLVGFFSLDKGETTRHQTALPVLNSTRENRYSSTFFPFTRFVQGLQNSKT